MVWRAYYRIPYYDCYRLVKGGIFNRGQSWKALKKCWNGYKIAKSDNDITSMLMYAQRIQKIQYELGVAVVHFPRLGI